MSKCRMNYRSPIQAVLGFFFTAVSFGCSDPARNISIPPVNSIPPFSEAPPFPARRPANLDSARPQKLVLGGSVYFDPKKQAWMTQYFSLPPRWNAVHLGMKFDSPYGIIELPDGRSIRWQEPDAIGGDFVGPSTEVIWKRMNADASIEYGVIRRPDGVREFHAVFSAGRAVFSTTASSEPLSDIVTFITPITIPAPCKDCVVPRPRK